MRVDPISDDFAKAGVPTHLVDAHFERLSRGIPIEASLFRVIAEVAYESKIETDSGGRGKKALATIRRVAEMLAAPRT